jgi:hypothetical protein
MAYLELKLHSGDEAVDHLIRRTIEPYLVEAHYLLCATRPSESPDGHFPIACCMMLLAVVAATSALPNYERDGKRRTSDGKHFVDCVRKYFPWESIRIKDDQYRTDSELVGAASDALYKVFRCPLFHSAGIVGSNDTACRLIKVHPGHADITMAEQRIIDLEQCTTLDGQVVIELRFHQYSLYIDYFYWYVRKLLERFAADPENARLIRQHSLAK